MHTNSYRQDSKSAARETVLPAAVTALTTKRNAAAIVRNRRLLEVVEFALTSLQKSFGKDEYLRELRHAVASETEEWLDFRDLRVSQREPGELKVLYLCGPEPLNDLEVLMENGVNPNNVWAVTSSANDVRAAVVAIRDAGTPLKIHHGPLAEFFEAFNESFDIIYVDACGPFLGGKPNTLEPVLRILTHQRLEPLSALITNYCELPDTDVQRSRYCNIMTSFFMYRYRDLPRIVHEFGPDPAVFQHEGDLLAAFVEKNIDEFYSDFITRFTSDLATHWVPNCRALSIRALSDKYLVPRKELKQKIQSAKYFPIDATSIEELCSQTGDMLLSPSSYPLCSFIRRLKENWPDDPLIGQLGNAKINGREMEPLLEIAALLDQVIEGHWSCLSQKMIEAVSSSWFDRRRTFGCDAPLPNLLINSLLGMYGRPWFPNPRKSCRVSYRAKANRMYCDMIVLDQCRYFFDWFPTIDACSNRFESIAFQILARCILDQIGWHNWSSETHPFRGGAVASTGSIPASRPHEFKKRRSL